MAWLYEFHDVHALNQGEVASMLQELQALGLGPWQLMVVPAIEGASEEQRQGLAARLRTWKKEGHGLHLHGCHHKASRLLPRSASGRLALALTQGEAEFAGLGEADSEALLYKAWQAWLDLDIGEPESFVPPTWHANPWLRSQCQALGIGGYGGRWHVWKGDQCAWSPPFSCAGLPLFAQSLVRIASRLYVFPGLPRLVLHPVDFSPESKASTLAWVRRLFRLG